MSQEPVFYGPVLPELEQVKQRLREAAVSFYTPMSHMLEPMLNSGGKRLRPVLTLLASKLHPAPDPELPILMATAVELLHIATLIHDDTVDNASVRRGRPTLSSLFGQRTAVLVGDYIFAKSATLVCDTRNVHVVRLFAETIMHLSSGELRESYEALDWRQTREQYFQRVFGKTASLFQTAAEAGAILSGAPEDTVGRMRSFGYHVGMAFQVVDDLLDFQGAEEEVGKPVGSDLLQGTITLPAILFLERDPTRSQRLPTHPDPEALRKLLAEVRESTALQDCYAIADGLIDKAQKALESLPEGQARSCLGEMARYVLERRK